MDITVIRATTEDLDPDTRADIIRVCVAAHDEPDFERLFWYIPRGGRHFMAFRGVELVSHAVVTTRWLHVDGPRRLKTGYVDAVATLPAHQGQGYASAVMRLLAENVHDHEICCLETEKAGFYARLGWELWRGALAGIRDQELIPTPDQQGIMILRLEQTPDLDLDGDVTSNATASASGSCRRGSAARRLASSRPGTFLVRPARGAR